MGRHGTCSIWRCLCPGKRENQLFKGGFWEFTRWLWPVYLGGLVPYAVYGNGFLFIYLCGSFGIAYIVMFNRFHYDTHSLKRFFIDIYTLTLAPIHAVLWLLNRALRVLSHNKIPQLVTNPWRIINFYPSKEEIEHNKDWWDWPFEKLTELITKYQPPARFSTNDGSTHRAVSGMETAEDPVLSQKKTVEQLLREQRRVTGDRAEKRY